MKKFLPLLLLFLWIVPRTFLEGHFRYDRIDYIQILERKDNSLEISKYIPLPSPGHRMFAPIYWKVYYLGDKIIGEELYTDNRLVYYYIYYYEGEKVYQKGFYWHGIYRNVKYFQANEKNIKQGWIYKNYPESYRVYNARTRKLIYEGYYRDFEF